jgi:hypothetical protein
MSTDPRTKLGPSTVLCELLAVLFGICDMPLHGSPGVCLAVGLLCSCCCQEKNSLVSLCSGPGAMC